MNNISGIYAIINTINSKQYIGSAINIPLMEYLLRNMRVLLRQGEHWE